MKKVKYSFLYYSIFFSFIMAFVSGIQRISLLAFAFFVLAFIAALLVTRYVYQILEGLGVRFYEKHIQGIVEKIRRARKEVE